MELRKRGLIFGIVMLSVIPCGCFQRTGETEGVLSVGSHSATTPAHRLGPWGARHQQILDRMQRGDVDLIFIGDSITHGWEDSGQDVWNQYYAPRKAVNMGIRGDRTEHVLWRIEHGEVDGISPKVAVVQIGTNNIRFNTPQEAADGIRAVCIKLRSKLPKTKILLLAIFPYQEMPGEIRNNIAETNALAAEIADGKMIHFLDMGAIFLLPDGTLSPEYMPDSVHPGAEGYRLWAQLMEPTLAELLAGK